MIRTSQIFLTLNLLFVCLKCEIPTSCASKDYQPCITSTAECTFFQTSCAKKCSVSNDCSTDCCYLRFCVTKSAGNCSSTESSSDTPVLAIVLPTVCGAVIIFSIACLCRQRKKSENQQLIIMRTQNAAANSNGVMQNNNMQMSGQNQQFQQQMPNQQIYYTNQQFQGFVEPVQPFQQATLQPNNHFYGLNQQQIYATSQQQQIYMPYKSQQQVPGIFEAQLGVNQPFNQQAPGPSQHLQKSTNNFQTTYI